MDVSPAERRSHRLAGAGGEGFADCGVSGAGVRLALADPVHLRAAHWSSALCGRPAVLQGHLLRVPHLSLGATLQAIGLHIQPPCWESGACRSVAQAYRFWRGCQGDDAPNGTRIRTLTSPTRSDVQI